MSKKKNNMNTDDELMDNEIWGNDKDHETDTKSNEEKLNAALSGGWVF